MTRKEFRSTLVVDGVICLPVTSRLDVEKARRIFYELGRYLQYSRSHGWFNWQHLGSFVEIENPHLLQREHLDDPAYLAHHNFHYLPKK